MASHDVKEIRITDPYVTGIVARVKQSRYGGKGTATKTASQLILERFEQLERDSSRRPRRPQRVE